MASIPSARSKATDQKYLSLAEYKKAYRRESRKWLRSCEESALKVGAYFYGPLFVRRLKAQAKREGISPLEKLCRLERAAKGRGK